MQAVLSPQLNPHVLLRKDPGDLVFDFTRGEPKRRPFPSFMFKDILETQDINTYYHPTGDKKLKQQILDEFYPDSNCNASDSIYICAGAINALDLIFRTTLNRGDEVLIPDPGFPPYQKLIEMSGGKAIAYPLFKNENQFRFNLEAIEQRITNKTRYILINSPHNPTGAAATDSELMALADLLSANPHISFISDEVYSSILFNGKIHRSISSYSDQGLVVNSFSKSFAIQGFRVGWIYDPSGSLKGGIIDKVMHTTMGCVSSVSQEIAKKILLEKQDYFKMFDYETALNLSTYVLRKFGLEYLEPEGALYLMVKHDAGEDKQLVQRLEKDGIKIVAGSIYGDSLKGYLRTCIALPNDELVMGFSKLAKSILQIKD